MTLNSGIQRHPANSICPEVEERQSIWNLGSVNPTFPDEQCTRCLYLSLCHLRFGFDQAVRGEAWVELYWQTSIVACLLFYLLDLLFQSSYTTWGQVRTNTDVKSLPWSSNCQVYSLENLIHLAILEPSMAPGYFMKPIRASVGTRHSMSERMLERVVQNVNVSSSGSESSSKCLLCLQRKSRIQSEVKDCLKSINCHSLYLLFHWPLWDVVLFHESLCSVKLCLTGTWHLLSLAYLFGGCCWGTVDRWVMSSMDTLVGMQIISFSTLLR
jgi:hypothetical protein